MSLPSFDIQNVGDYHYTSALFGMRICLPMLFVMLLLSRRFMALSDGKWWYQRMPVAFNMNIDGTTHDGKLYQVIFLSAFLLLPSIAQIHFLTKFFQGTVFLKGSQAFAVGWQHLIKFVPPWDAFQDKYRYETACGITFFPFYEPWGLLLIELVFFVLFTRYLTQLFCIR